MLPNDPVERQRRLRPGVAGSGLPSAKDIARIKSSAPSAAVKTVFALFVFSVPFESIDILHTGGTFSLSRLIGLLMIGAALTQSQICFARPPAAFWLFAFYLATATLVGLTGPAAYWALARAPLMTLVQMLVLFWIASNLLRYPKVARSAIAALAGATLIVGALAIAGVGAQIDPRSGRLSMFDEDPNSIAGTLSLGMLAWIGLGRGFRRRRGIMERFWPIACLLLAAAITRTGSRGGVIALLCGVGALLLQKGEGRQTLRHAVLAVAVAATVVIALVLSPTSAMRWQTTLTERTAAGREDIFPAAWSMFLQRPIVGWGPVHNIAELGARMSYGTRGGGFGVRDTHNGLLWVLTETGIVGTVPYAIALFLCLRSAWKGRARAYGVLPFAIAVCVVMINMSLTWQTRKFYWLMLALAAASSKAPLIRAAVRPRAPALARFRGPLVPVGMEADPGGSKR